MANPLQPKCIKVIENEFGGYVINVMKSSKSGTGDLIACIPISGQGLFYLFEIKWKSDKPSELQKATINKAIDAGGKAYFITSADQLRYIVMNNVEPTKYPLKNRLVL